MRSVFSSTHWEERGRGHTTRRATAPWRWWTRNCPLMSVTRHRCRIMLVFVRLFSWPSHQVPINVSGHFIKLPSMGISPKFIVSAVLLRRKSCFYCPRHPGRGAGSTVPASILLQLLPLLTPPSTVKLPSTFLELRRRCNMLESQLLENVKRSAGLFFHRTGSTRRCPSRIRSCTHRNGV